MGGDGLDLTQGLQGIELATTGDAANPNLFASIGDADDDNDFSFTEQPA